MRFSLSQKTYFVLVLIIAFLFVGQYLYLNHVLESSYTNSKRIRLLEQILLVDALVRSKSIVFKTNESVDMFANEVGNLLSSRVTLIDANGVVVGDSNLTASEVLSVENHAGREELSHVDSDGVGFAKRFSTTVGQELLYVGKKFSYGYIRLAIPISETRQFMQTFQQTQIFALLVMMLLGAALFYIGFNPMQRFVARLNEFSEHLSQGDFNFRLNEKFKDERGQIALSLNQMTRSVGDLMNSISRDKNYFKSILETINEGVFVVDTEERIVLINRAMRQQFHLEQKPEGRTPKEYLQNELITEAVKKVLEQKISLQREIQFTDVAIDKHFMLFVAPLLGLDGAVAVFYDVTDLKKLEEMRRGLVANVSHEFKTPLTSILGYAETMLDHPDNLDDLTVKFLNIIHRNAQLLSDLVNDVLNLSRIESGRFQLALQNMDLHKAIRDCQDYFRRKLQERNVTLAFEFSHEPLMIQADKQAIDQVLNNIIGNAIKYNKQDGKVMVRTRVIPDFVEIEIEDTGIGISEKDQMRVFERFYRVDPSRTKAEGTGLGLSIVKHLIQSHEGTISVKSEADKGSVFVIRLPHKPLMLA